MSPRARSIILTISYIIAMVLLVAAAAQVVPAGPWKTATMLVGIGIFTAIITTRLTDLTAGKEGQFPWPLIVCWTAAAGFIIAGLGAVTPDGPARQFVWLGGTGAALALLGWWFFSDRSLSVFGPATGESKQDRDTRWTRDTVLTFSYVGIAGLILFAIRSVVPSGPVEGLFRVLGAGTLIACGSLLGGALIGFLFGIPRAQTGSRPAVSGGGANESNDPNKPPSPPASARGSQAEFDVNTNLEQISDWLTKIIVGMGLINLRKIPGYFQGLGAYFSGALGSDIQGSESVVLALIILFLVCGFLLGYLLTRLFLTGAFTRAISPEDQLRATLLEAGTGGGTGSGGKIDIAAIQKIDQVASRVSPEQVRQQVFSLATEYNATRASMRPGAERTRKLDSMVVRMQGLAKQAYDMLPELRDGLTDGEELAAVAFLQIIPNKDYIAWLADRFGKTTPFTMYHAAVALRSALNALGKAARAELTAALQQALDHAPEGESNTRKILEESLASLTS